MYESETYERILARCLDRVPSNVDKREGSIIFDALAPACLELAKLYIACDFTLNQTSILTANRQGLMNWGDVFAIKAEPATNATVKAVFNMDISIGSRFNSDKLNFKVVEKLDGEHVYKLECENLGSQGNNCIGKIVPINNISGLKRAEILSLIAPGEDEEDTEAYRKRLILELKSDAYGGNKADYIVKVNKIKGVGGCKVYRCPRGGGTVDVVIINSDFKKPSDELVDEVQTVLDPTKNDGHGLGVAPIGHDVLVKAVVEKELTLDYKLYLKHGVDESDAKAKVSTKINAYFGELAKTWTNVDAINVRVAHLISQILTVDGVTDVTNVTINGERERVILESDEIPKLKA